MRWRDGILRGRSRSRLRLWLAASVLALLSVGALAAGLITGDPLENRLGARLAPPGGEHLLGTDNNGRDVLARLAHGARVSLGVGAASMGLALAIGVLIGGVAGMAGGWTDFVLTRAVEVVLCFPALFLALGAMAVLGPSTANVIAVLGVMGFPPVARLVRAEVLRLRHADFAAAARASGAGFARILVRHLIPNAMGPVWVLAAFGVAGAIVSESALSFLGVGVQEPTATWGQSLSLVRSYPHAWWLGVFPGFALFVTLAALNVIAEELGSPPRRR